MQQEYGMNEELQSLKINNVLTKNCMFNLLTEQNRITLLYVLVKLELIWKFSVSF